MGLDKGDEMIRQRLILKLRNVFFSKVVPEAPTEEQLKSWFEQHRARYDMPARYDFEQFLVGDAEGPDVAEDLARQLGGDEPGDVWQDKLRRYTQRPLSNLEMVFGEEHASLLVSSSDDRWLPVRSPAGWHLARITGSDPAEPADLVAIRSRVLEDYKADAVQQQLVKGMQAVAQSYDIRIDLSTPPEQWDEQRIEDIRLAMEELP
jgi:hypothetical protein